MKFTLDIDLDNDAFREGRMSAELAAILVALGTALNERSEADIVGINIPMRDINGNPIGRAVSYSELQVSPTEALESLTRTFIDGTHYETCNPYSRPAVRTALRALARAQGKSTFGSDWMNAIEINSPKLNNGG